MRIDEIDSIVKLIDFPNKKIKEAVTTNEDGSFTIFIESSLTKEQQQKSSIHAIEHITGEDFNKDDVERIERQAHQIVT